MPKRTPQKREVRDRAIPRRKEGTLSGEILKTEKELDRIDAQIVSLRRKQKEVSTKLRILCQAQDKIVQLTEK